MLTIDGLTKRRGDRDVLRGVGFGVHEGEVVGLLGSNGAGKSTLVSIVAGLLPADDGTVDLRDTHGTPLGPPAMAVATQETGLYPSLTCNEHLRFFGRLYGLRGSRLRNRVAEVIERMGLLPYRESYAHTLSGGWRRRLHVAVALVHEPRLLLLDEPTVGLDVEARALVWKQARALCDRGSAVLLTTNVIEEAEALCDRVVVLIDGRVAAADTVDGLRRIIPAIELAAVTCDDDDALRRCADSAGIDVRDYAGQTTLLLKRHTSVSDLAQRFSEASLRSIALQPVSLTQVYLELHRASTTHA